MDFSSLIEHIQSRYYVQVILFFVELTALVFGLRLIKKDKIARLFVFYISFDFLIMLISFYLISINFSKSYGYLYNITNTLIAICELLIYYYFFSRTISNKRIKSLLILFSIFFILLAIIYISTKFSFITSRKSYAAYIIGAIEFILLLPPCILYFRELLKKNSPINLFERPSFWIVTGIFFYSLISIPFYLSFNYFMKINHSQILIIGSTFYYIPIIINFLFLIKAFTCKNPLTT
jgi:hypothetical protein